MSPISRSEWSATKAQASGGVSVVEVTWKVGWSVGLCASIKRNGPGIWTTSASWGSLSAYNYSPASQKRLTVHPQGRNFPFLPGVTMTEEEKGKKSAGRGQETHRFGK